MLLPLQKWKRCGNWWVHLYIQIRFSQMAILYSAYSIWYFERKFHAASSLEKQELITVWKLRKFTLTLFWQKFRESNTLSTATGNLLSHLCSTLLAKISWKQRFLLKKSLKCWFDEIFFQREKIYRFSTMCWQATVAKVMYIHM